MKNPGDINGYRYSGDVNLKYGGLWIKPDGTQYATVVEVNDLDSAIGYADAYLIEEGTVYFSGDKRSRREMRSALSVVGQTMADLRALPKSDRRFELARALWVYGRRDIDSKETVIMGADAAESFDGWESDTRLRANANLVKYVAGRYLA